MSNAILLNRGNIQDSIQKAKTILCTSKLKPCEICKSCIKVNRGVHPDLKIFQDFKSVTQAREIRQDSIIFPNDGDAKVYIIQDAENMTIQAQNALLKILEEPPSHTFYILICQNSDNILQTIISRLKIFNYPEKKYSPKYKTMLQDYVKYSSNQLDISLFCKNLSTLTKIELKIFLKEIILLIHSNIIFQYTGENKIGIHLQCKNLTQLYDKIQELIKICDTTNILMPLAIITYEMCYK